MQSYLHVNCYKCSPVWRLCHTVFVYLWRQSWHNLCYPLPIFHWIEFEFLRNECYNTISIHALLSCGICILWPFYVALVVKINKSLLSNRDELRIGHLRNQALKDFEKVALGDVQDNIRARLKEKGLTEEQQVAALIDQATDPNILGRTWGGWEPWL